MSINTSGDNKYYQHVMSTLIELTGKRKSLETNFDRRHQHEYDDVCNEQIDSAIELIKLGAECELKNDKICILTENGEVIEFPADEIREKTGDTTFYVLFPEQKDEEESDLDLELEDDDYFDEPYRGRAGNPIGDDGYQKAMLMNPMSMFFRFLMGLPDYCQSSPPPEYRSNYRRTSDKGNPMAELQEQMDSLKETKERIRRKAVQYKKDYETVKSQYDESCREKEEMQSIAMDNLRKYDEEKARFAAELENSVKVVEEKDCIISEKEQEIGLLKEKLDSIGAESDREKEELKDAIAQFSSELIQKAIELNQKDEQYKLIQADMEQNQQTVTLLEEKVHAAEEREKDSVLRINELTIQLQKSSEEHEGALNSIKAGRSEADKKLNDLTAEQNRLQNRIESLQNEVINLKNKNKELQNEANSLRNKLKDNEQKANEAQKARLSMEERNNRLISELEQLKADNKEAKSAAYRDMKFDAGNEFGFTSQINDKSKDVAFVAMIDVLGMGSINSEYEEEAGDNVIRMTIDALSNAFGNENVYRIRGAQFGVIFADGDYRQIRNSIETIKQSLRANNDFDIVFGLASMERSTSRTDMVNKARAAMRRAKSDADMRNSQPVQNYVDANMSQAYSEQQYVPQQYVPQGYSDNTGGNMYYSNVQQPAEVQMQGVPMSQNGYVQSMPSSTNANMSAMPANPNIASSMAANLYDDYNDSDNTIKEMDSTSIDLAMSIMDQLSKAGGGY